MWSTPTLSVPVTTTGLVETAVCVATFTERYVRTRRETLPAFIRYWVTVLVVRVCRFVCHGEKREYEMALGADTPGKFVLGPSPATAQIGQAVAARGEADRQVTYNCHLAPLLPTGAEKAERRGSGIPNEG